MAKSAYNSISGALGLVVAVGSEGRILHFTGDIYHGVEVPSPTRANLRAVHVLSPLCAWAVGEHGTVLRWDGTAWHAVVMASLEDDLLAVWGATPEDIWVGGWGFLAQNAGNQNGTVLTRTDNTVVGVWGSGPEDVWLLCAGRLLLHWNGTTCKLHELPGDEGDEYFAIGGGTADEAVWIGGMAGLVLRGDGEGWEEINARTEANITGICAITEENVWVTTNEGQIRHFNGGGWRTEVFSPFGWLSGLCVVDGTIWACGAGGVVLQHRSEDGGDRE